MNTNEDLIAPGLGRRVLVIDDDRMQRKLLTAQLVDAGFVVDGADGAATALRTIAHRRPDVVVSDVLMDDVDGFSLCRVLRRDRELANVPIVLMSAYFNEGPDKNLALEVGASALVTRTPTAQACIETIVRCLVEKPTDVIMEHTSELHLNRVAHQLTRFRDESVESERRLAKYRSLVENVPEVVWSSTLDGILTFISSNVARLTGDTVNEIIAAASEQVARIHPDDASAIDAARRAMVEGGEQLDVECRFQHKDGRWIWLHVRAVVACDPDGTPCIDGVVSDVTERKRLQEQLCQSQKIEIVGQLTAGIAHNFGNLLTVISANAQALVEMLPAGEWRDVAAELTAAANSGVDMTSKLLGFARRRAENPKEIDINLVMENVLRMVQHTVARSIAIDLSCCSTLGPAYADARDIEQVVLNLAVNAQDAMPRGGKLRMKTFNVGDEWVAISVKDTGTGMDAATRERMFEPFFTTKPTGTGLGLSTSFQIVRRYGGRIDVASSPGEGTEFTIFLPRRSKPVDPV